MTNKELRIDSIIENYPFWVILIQLFAAAVLCKFWIWSIKLCLLKVYSGEEETWKVKLQFCQKTLIYMSQGPQISFLVVIFNVYYWGSNPRILCYWATSPAHFNLRMSCSGGRWTCFLLSQPAPLPWITGISHQAWLDLCFCSSVYPKFGVHVKYAFKIKLSTGYKIYDKMQFKLKGLFYFILSFPTIEFSFYFQQVGFKFAVMLNYP